MPIGIILKGIGGFYYVKGNDEIYECKARGIFRKDAIKPLPGDKVVFNIVDAEKKQGVIDEILPRTSCLERPSVANVNQIFIVISVKSPLPDFLLLDKLLITAELKKLKSVIIINKIDLDGENSHMKTVKCYENAGYPVIPISSKTKFGMERLQEFLKDNITVLAGQSGVGKSTILNNILNDWVMETGNISEKIERGRHTTRHAEIVELKGGGYLVDTPGFSSFELNNIDCNEVGYYYQEFRDKMDQCRFAGCSHITEPGCMVKDALCSGMIDRDRYERYIEIYNFLKQQKKYY